MQASLTVTMRGLNGVICHNSQLADPLNQYTRRLKSITSKRGKTDDDIIEGFKVEWEGGLYLNDKGEPIVPGLNIEALLRKAAAKLKAKGKVLSGIQVDEDPKLEYDGPATLEGLRPRWEEFSRRDIVRNPSTGSRLPRCRPFFREWSLTYTISYNTEILDREKVEDIIRKTPEIGLLEWAPRFGRFEIVKIS